MTIMIILSAIRIFSFRTFLSKKKFLRIKKEKVVLMPPSESISKTKVRAFWGCALRS